MRITSCAALTVLIFASGAAFAESETDQGISLSMIEIDTSFEVTHARLMAEGFREIRMIRDDPYHLSAYDQQGGEVVLRVSPTDGTFARSYVHETDK